MGSTSAVHETVQPGALLLGKYRVYRKLGSGGMGFVVVATHVDLGDQVAIKVLHTRALENPEARQRFLREAQSLVKLKSEHVVRVTDVGVLEDGSPYMIMEYLDGADLHHLAHQAGLLGSRMVVDHVMQVCEALAEAHSRGLVHRDIKPSNIFVTTRADGSPLVKVLDFGISKGPGGGEEMSLTRTDSTLGTPAYMSPEQMRSARHVDPRSDLWSLGIVLYELLEGARPWLAETYSEMVLKVATDPPDPMRVAEPGLQAVVARCLQKSPATRFGNAAELAAALAPFASNAHEARLRVERIGRILARTHQVSMGDPSTPPFGVAFTAPVATTPNTAPPSSHGAPTTYTEPSPTAHAPGARRHLTWLIGLLVIALGGVVTFVIVREPRTESAQAATDAKSAPPVENAAPIQATAQDAAAPVDAAPTLTETPSIDAGSSALDLAEGSAKIKKPPRERHRSPPRAGSADAGSAAWTNRK